MKKLKLVFIPNEDREKTLPHGELILEWASRLQDSENYLDIKTPESLIDAKNELQDADAAFGTFTPDLLSVCKNLKWIQCPAAAPPEGYYFPELVDHSAQVTNMREIYNDHISFHIMSMLLAFSKSLHIYMRRQFEGKWIGHSLKNSTRHLPECTALIVGVGGIGAETGKYCADFGMRVLGVDARREDVPEGVEKIFKPDYLDQLIPEADFIISTIPHNPVTEGLFNIEKFKLMKKSAYFINIGRGMTTKLDDLVTALENGEISGAGLDVYEIEPLPEDHPLWLREDVILTPHVATWDVPYLDERRYQIVLDNCRALNEGKDLRNVVDKKLWF